MIKTIFSFGFLVASLYGQNTYNITTFTVPGASQVIPGAISNDGVVVGIYNTIAGGPNFSYGFLRSPDGSFTTFEPPGSTGDLYAFAITSNGEVYGSFTVAPQTYQSFAYKDGVYRLLSINGENTEVYSGNDYGAITGFYGSNPNSFLYRPGQPLIELEDPGQQQTSGSAINDKGVLVGYNNDDYGENESSNGFEFIGNRYIPINVPYPAQDTIPTWINNEGVVVGIYTYDNLYYHGFVYQDGKYQDFVVPGATHTFLDGINDRGVLSGEYQDADGNVLAFIATPTQ